MRGFVSICLGYEFSICEKEPWSLKSSVYSKIVFGNEGSNSFISLVVCCHCSRKVPLQGGWKYLLFTAHRMATQRDVKVSSKNYHIFGNSWTWTGYGITFMCSICETQRWRQSLTQQQNVMDVMVLSTTATQTQHLLEPRFRIRTSWLPIKVSGCSVKKRKSVHSPREEPPQGSWDSSNSRNNYSRVLACSRGVCTGLSTPCSAVTFLTEHVIWNPLHGGCKSKVSDMLFTCRSAT